MNAHTSGLRPHDATHAHACEHEQLNEDSTSVVASLDAPPRIHVSELERGMVVVLRARTVKVENVFASLWELGSYCVRVRSLGGTYGSTLMEPGDSTYELVDDAGYPGRVA